MKDIINSLATAFERLYQGFVLRDLLGYVLPGSIFLLSIWSLIAPNLKDTFCNQPQINPSSPLSPLECFSSTLGANWETMQIVAFLGGSYLIALILQSLHYGLADIVYQLVDRKSFRRIIWPISGIWYYMKGISQPFDENKEVSTLSENPSLMSIGALAPDKALQKLKNENALSRFQESKAYTERLSVLQIVMGNTIVAGIPFLALLSKVLGGWTILGAIVLIFGYLEHWRLFYVRNLRHEILIEAANAIEENAQNKDGQPKEPTDDGH